MPPQLKSMGNSIIRKSATPAISPYCRLSYFLGLLLCLFQGPDEMLKLRWNSQSGAVYVDGQHFKVRNGPAVYSSSRASLLTVETASARVEC
jgi:hypothetical protein